MRIATVHLLVDVDSDADACDFCSETFGNMMPYVVDWAHVSPAKDILNEESTAQYIQLGDYEEGDFLRSAKSFIRRELIQMVLDVIEGTSEAVRAAGEATD